MNIPYICSMCLRCIHYDNDDCQQPFECDAVFSQCEYCSIECSAYESEYAIYNKEDDIPF